MENLTNFKKQTKPKCRNNHLLYWNWLVFTLQLPKLELSEIVQK